MEKRYLAHFEAMASHTVEFVFDPDDLEGEALQDALEDAAYAAFRGVSICHQCAYEVDLAEFDLIDNGPIVEA
jgi:hypothetical protein